MESEWRQRPDPVPGRGADERRRRRSAEETVETARRRRSAPAAAPAPRVVVSAAKPARASWCPRPRPRRPPSPNRPPRRPRASPAAGPEAPAEPDSCRVATSLRHPPSQRRLPRRPRLAEPAADPAAPPQLQPFKAKTPLKLAKLLVTFESGGGDLKKAFGQFDTNDDGHLAVAEARDAALQGWGIALGGT